MSLHYVHTNIIAKDWKKLAQFYIEVFDCSPMYPERDMSGEWIDKMTNIQGVHIKGIHLALPGTEGKQTLEIFSYNNESSKAGTPRINDQGFSHIAFRTNDVQAVVDKALANGGKFYGEITEANIENVGHLTAVYMLDPEDNIVEIQSWK